MPEGAKAWFNRARFAGNVMAVGSIVAGVAGVLFGFLIRLAFGWDDEKNLAEPWSTGDIWFVCIYFTWLFILPASLLTAFNYARRKQRYLYVCTPLIALATAAQFALTLRFAFPFSVISLAILCGFTGWLIALYLVSIVWSEIRLARKPTP